VLREGRTFCAAFFSTRRSFAAARLASYSDSVSPAAAALAARFASFRAALSSGAGGPESTAAASVAMVPGMGTGLVVADSSGRARFREEPRVCFECTPSGQQSQLAATYIRSWFGPLRTTLSLGHEVRRARKLENP
jgi:hypothetical protein